MKKIISLIIVIALLLSLTVTAHAANTESYLVGTIDDEIVNTKTDTYTFKDNKLDFTVVSEASVFVNYDGRVYVANTSYSANANNCILYDQSTYTDSAHKLTFTAGTWELTVADNGPSENYDRTIKLTCTAVENTNTGGTVIQPTSNSKDVTGNYIAKTEAGTVYSVDIAWGGMTFDYNAGSEGTWNATNHEYTGVVEPYWSWSTDNDNNKITVTNHSNTAIDAKLGFAPAAGINVTGAFKDAAAKDSGNAIANDTLRIENAENGAAQIGYAFFHITGGEISAKGTIGTITVTINAAA